MQQHLPDSYASNSYIYVLLTDTGTLFTRLIKAFTGAPYNHASLALDSELKELYSFGRKCPMNPWAAGFVEEDVSEGTYRLFPDTRCALLRLQVAPCQREAMIRKVRRFQEQKGEYRYNLLGLLGILLNVGLASGKSYFCSQFVAEVLASGEVTLWPRPSSLIAPDDFRQHPAFELVYEGPLYQYPKLDRGAARDSHLEISSVA